MKGLRMRDFCFQRRQEKRRKGVVKSEGGHVGPTPPHTHISYFISPLSLCFTSFSLGVSSFVLPTAFLLLCQCDRRLFPLALWIKDLSLAGTETVAAGKQDPFPCMHLPVCCCTHIHVY